MVNQLTAVATLLAAAKLLSFAVSTVDDGAKVFQAQFSLAETQRAAPNFVGISNWLNSGPLNLADLRGKVGSRINSLYRSLHNADAA
jgi:hypothetical protein